MAGGRSTGQGSLHGPATLMAQHDNEAGTEVFDRVFDAAQGVLIDQVASRADHKKVAEVLVENNFRRSAGVGTTQDDGKRVLRLGDFSSFGGGGLAGGNLAVGKAIIACFELGERDLGSSSRSMGGRRSSVRMLGRGTSSEATEAECREQGEFVSWVHFFG